MCTCGIGKSDAIFKINKHIKEELGYDAQVWTTDGVKLNFLSKKEDAPKVVDIIKNLTGGIEAVWSGDYNLL